MAKNNNDGRRISRLEYWLAWFLSGFPKRYGDPKAFVIQKGSLSKNFDFLAGFLIATWIIILCLYLFNYLGWM